MFMQTRAPMTDTPGRGRVSSSTAIYYAVAIFFFLYLFVYFWTSEGGPTLLAMTLVPVTFVLFVLNALRENDLYPRPAAGRQLRHRRGLHRLALAVSYYMHTEYYALGTSRAGDWNSTDLLVGGLMAVLVMEYSRKRHMPLFVLNIVLDALRGLWLGGARHVLSCGPELGARRHRHERRDDDRRVLQPAADRAHGDRLVPARAQRAERLWLHRVAAARDQAGRDPLAARAAAVGGGRLDVRRHRERQRRGQRHHHRLGHHSRP